MCENYEGKCRSLSYYWEQFKTVRIWDPIHKLVFFSYNIKTKWKTKTKTKTLFYPSFRYLFI